MNIFQNDGSFMEQFLKRQKLNQDGDSSSVASSSTTTIVGGGGGEQTSTTSPPAYDHSASYTTTDPNSYYSYDTYYSQDPAYAAYYQQQQQHPGADQYGGGGGGRYQDRFVASPPSKVIWAGNIHPETQDDEVRNLFAPYGYIKSIKVVPARRFAFITFADLNCSITALGALNGHIHRGLPLKLNYGKPDPRDTIAPVTDSNNPPCKNLWVGNVASSVSEDALKEVFEAYGKVDNVRILFGKQCAFVNFVNLENAIAARNQLQGRTVQGYNLTINYRRESDGDGSRPDGSRSGGFNKREDRGGGGGAGGGVGGDRGMGGGGGNGGFNDNFRNNMRTAIDGNPMPVPPPSSAKEQVIIDKMADYVARNGPRFESYTQDKQSDNSQFNFLKTGHPTHDYYRWKLWTIKNPDAHSSDSRNNNINNVNSPNNLDNNINSINSFMNSINNNNNNNTYQSNQQTTPPTDYLNNSQIEEFKDIIQNLNSTRGSITSCKTWIIEHVSHALEIISIITTTHQSNRLTFQQKLNILHVLNDALHTSLSFRNNKLLELDEFSRTIQGYLPFIVASTSAEEPRENQAKVVKVLNIWESNSIYPKHFIDELKNAATDQS